MYRHAQPIPTLIVFNAINIRFIPSFTTVIYFVIEKLIPGNRISPLVIGML